MRILIVEDERDLAGFIAAGLRHVGMAVDICHTGTEAILRVEVTEYDAVILDRGLPDISGDEVCRNLATVTSRPRILMLTAAGEVNDRVEGLTIGADDYMGKPFAMIELVARLQALGRRPASGLTVILQWRDLKLDVGRHLATRIDRDLGLSRKEFAVLEELLRADGSVVSSETLLEKVWDENADPFTNVVRVTMMNLRRKLGDPGLIETIIGVGYRMEEPG